MTGMLGNAAPLPLARAEMPGLWDDAEMLAAGEPDAEGAEDGDSGAASAAAAASAAPALTLCAVAEPDDAALAALLVRIVTQDAKALEALYDATCARVHGLVLRIVQRPALAEEVVEDIYWQVWRQAPRFDASRGRPVSWLLTMARSRAIDALRRDERFRHEELTEESLADEDGHTPAPQDLLDATRGAASLHDALAALEPRTRQLVSLAFFRGLTHEEIADREAMPLGTVKSLIRRALLQLRRVLEGGGS